MASSVTTEHEIIKSWAEKYGGIPQRINDPVAEADVIGIRLNFRGRLDDEAMPAGEVQNISWDEFFKRFENQQLAFVYSKDIEPTDSEEVKSNSYRFIKRQILENQDRSGQEYLHRQQEIKEFMNHDTEE